jgi:hypothetical protein
MSSKTSEMLEKEAQEEAAFPAYRQHSAKPRRIGLAQHGLAWASALASDLLGPREPDAFGILMYHRIANPVPGYVWPTWNVTPQRFAQQLKGLLSRGWQPWPLREVLSCRARKLPIPRKTFVVTFDDGYANVFRYACPVLSELHVPATVFLATGYLDSEQPFPNDDWPAAGRPGVPRDAWRPLMTDECRRLTANGLVELGAHTPTSVGGLRISPLTSQKTLPCSGSGSASSSPRSRFPMARKRTASQAASWRRPLNRLAWLAV